MLDFKLPEKAAMRYGPGNEEVDLSTLRRASVALIFRNVGNNPELLMIKRAERLDDRWSGHIAMPGGRQDSGETDFETAVREVREEVGLDLKSTQAKYLGALPPRIIRGLSSPAPILVLCPYVFEVEGSLKLTPQPSEVAAVFWTEWKLLLNGIKNDSIPLQPTVGQVVLSGEMPPLPWTLWGITLGILKEFAEVVGPKH